MSLLIFEGFDHASASDDLFAGLMMSANATASSAFDPDPTTQFGGKSLGITTLNASNTTSVAYAMLYGPTGTGTATVGVSILATASPLSGYDIGLSNGLQGQMFCRFILDQVVVYRGDPTTGGVVIASGATGMISSGWCYIELQAVLSTTVGTVTIRINGAPILTFNNLNNTADGTTTINGCIVGVYDGTGNGFRGRLDDIYMVDSAGPVPYNNFLGPSRVIMRLPNANSSVAFMPSANTNWQQVSESNLDGDDSFNSSTTPSTTDLFSANSLPTTTSSIFAVQVKAAVRKDDAGLRSIATALNSAATAAIGTTVALSPTYRYINDIYVNDPHTSGSWSVDAVGASTFGYTIV